MNYVFYVTDEMDAMPLSGRLRKMDAGREIADHIQKGIKHCDVLRYTDYMGEKLDADSVGIVFPAHSWGISLAIYSFMQNLRVGKDTYLYAVAVGEHLDYKASSSVKIIEQFKRVIEKKCLNRKSDIYVRCRDIKRDAFSEGLSVLEDECYSLEDKVAEVLDGLLYHCYDEIKNKPRIEKQYNEFGLNYGYSFEKTGRSRTKLNNIYLDDSMFAGVRFSKVI